ncbi:uncharacterized protein RHO25_002376 [Cercospora beticola]|uniref:Uncharacterized protein n=1 Tax=Cercospora beticola TaxID=122368 RepID=A0ABZ0NE09_CERBT|nr:hypothetical protein RHO25_002376 [Cercospora beticola]
MSSPSGHLAAALSTVTARHATTLPRETRLKLPDSDHEFSKATIGGRDEYNEMEIRRDDKTKWPPLRMADR